MIFLFFILRIEKEQKFSSKSLSIILKLQFLFILIWIQIGYPFTSFFLFCFNPTDFKIRQHELTPSRNAMYLHFSRVEIQAQFYYSLISVFTHRVPYTLIHSLQ